MSKQITVKDLLQMFLHHIVLIIIMTLIGGILAYGYVSFFVTPMYSTSAMILVQSSATFEGTTTNSTQQSLSGEKVNTQDITSSNLLANTCATLFMVVPEMKSIISGASINIVVVEDSYFLRINSTSADPHTAATIANRVAAKAPDVFKQYIGDGGKVKTVEEASVPGAPSSPDKMRYMIMGLLIGLVISLVISFLLEIVDTTIKSGDDLYKLYEIPVFAEIIDFEAEGGAKKK